MPKAVEQSAGTGRCAAGRPSAPIWALPSSAQSHPRNTHRPSVGAIVSVMPIGDSQSVPFGEAHRAHRCACPSAVTSRVVHRLGLVPALSVASAPFSAISTAGAPGTMAGRSGAQDPVREQGASCFEPSQPRFREAAISEASCRPARQVAPKPRITRIRMALRQQAGACWGASEELRVSLARRRSALLAGCSEGTHD